MSAAEALAATFVSAFAVTMLVVYCCHLIGLSFTPSLVAGLAATSTVVIGSRLFRRAHTRVSELLGYAAVVAVPLGWMLWRSAPSFLPLGSQGDLTHHLQLVDYIERHWHLPRGPEVDRYLAEMTHYTPGLHAIAALVGRWLRSDGLHVVHGVVATAVALKVGFVYLIALRMSAALPQRVPLALAASALAVTPYAYVFDSFMRDGFLPQALSELFVLGMWWSLGAWDHRPDHQSLALFGLFGCGAFLSWPIYTGPPALAAVGLLAFRREPRILTRVAHGAWAFVPLALVATAYIGGRSALLAMSGALGAAPRPSLWTFGALLPILALVGFKPAWHGRSAGARPTLWLLTGVAAQSSALYLQALAAGNASAYMAFKTLYLLPYPLAALATVAMIRLLSQMRPRRLSSRAAAWLFFAVAAGEASGRLTIRPPEARAVTDPMWRAGLWARDHLPRGCLAYMVPDDDTAYWLHLAVLRNPRASDRTADEATYDMTETTLRWYGPTALPYAIADLNAVSRSVRVDLQELARFDTAAVVRHRGTAACADAHLPPPP